MLDLALNHQEELKKRFRETWFSSDYFFLSGTNYYEELIIVESTWDWHQFVSLDSKGDIIGYISYSIDRSAYLVEGFEFINFSDDKVTFGIDVAKVIKAIFEKFNFTKLNFSVIIDNPIEEDYDKLIEKYNGKIVGVQRNQVRLYDGKLYDKKLYEILNEDYKLYKEKKHENCSI